MTEPLSFYDCSTAPSPRRARIFIAEKGLSIPTIEVNLAKEEQLGAEFKAVNPRCTVPVLTLDDGTAITENIGIAHFLEAYCCDPPLLGTTAKEKGLIAAWNARIEFEGLMPVADAFRNRSKGLKGRAVVGPRNHDQIPALGERGHLRGLEFMEMLDQQLVNSSYVAGNQYSMADITALCVVEFAAWVKITPEAHQTNLKRWFDLVKQRPSSNL